MTVDRRALESLDSMLSAPITRRTLLRGGLVAGAGVFLAACGGGKTGTGATLSPAGGIKTPKTKPDKITVRAWGDPWSTALGDFPGKAFTAETGVKVEFDLSDIGEVQTKVQQALAAGNRPPVDVVYTIVPLAYSAEVQKLSIPLNTDIVTNFAELTSVGKPASGSSYVSLYTYTLPVIYNKAKVTFPAAIDWNALFDTKFKKSIFVAANPPPLLYPIAKMMGVPLDGDLTAVWKKIGELKPNVGSIGDDTTFINTMTSGDVSLGVGGLIGDATALQDAKVDVTWIVPTGGCTLTADSMYVCRGLPDDVTYYAQKFVNHVIDATQQTGWCQKVATVPTNSKAKPAAFMKGDPGFPFTEEEIAKYAVPEPVALAAQKNDEWQAAYSAAIGGTGPG